MMKSRNMSGGGGIQGATALKMEDEFQREVYVAPQVQDYAVRLVMATRQPEEWGVPELLPLVVHGASPRGSLGLRNLIHDRR